MNDINHILNDESINDKQLIKELSIYIKNHDEKNLPLNKKFVEDIIDITLRNSEIEYNGVYFINDNNFIAFWYSTYMELYFNVTEMFKNAMLLKDEYLKSKIGKNKIFIYFDTISTVIHEITHARQFYVMNKDKNEIYSSCNELINEMHDVYKMNHDYVLTERYANLRGNTIAYQVMSYVYKPRIVSEFRSLIFDYLTQGYEVDYRIEDIDPETGLVYIDINEDSPISCALDFYNQIMEECSLEKVNIEAEPDMALYDRLYMGLPIDTDEFVEINTSVLKDILDKEKKDKDVKQLIKDKDVKQLVFKIKK